MRILIDIGHPAHVHMFKNFAIEMIKNNHEILFLTRDKEFEIQLLEKYAFNYISLGKKRKSLIAKIFNLLKYTIRIIIISNKFKPEIFLSHGSIYAAWASFFYRKPHISLEDTFNFEQIRLYKPFTKSILTSDYKQPDLGEKNIRYSGYHELLYLHPKYFHANKDIKKKLGLIHEEKYVIVRFVSWDATHDIGHKGICLENKIKIVSEMSKFAHVFISSEFKLPNQLEQYRFPLSPELIHDAIAYSSLVFGESATMISEGAMLGVPGIYLDKSGRIYTRELEKKYNLVYNYTDSNEDQQKAFNKAIELLLMNDIHSLFLERKNKMLKDKIDVTAFLVWFIEKYPDSFITMKTNPDFQFNFK
jgi:uncharacterized protein